MLCSLCGKRKAKRACPALDQQICAVCCGTKRLVEIRCPAGCVYLATARTHPPAVVQRQHQQNRDLFLPLLRGLSERQARLLMMLGAVISKYQGEDLQKLRDDDIAQAAEALASTLETSGRGIVYEHRAQSLLAERLLAELTPIATEVAHRGGSGVERDTAIALRRIGEAAKAGAKARPDGADFHELLINVLTPEPGTEVEDETQPATEAVSPLILP